MEKGEKGNRGEKMREIHRRRMERSNCKVVASVWRGVPNLFNSLLC